MKIGVTGASGFIGQELIRRAVSQGDYVVAFTRDPATPVPGAARTELFGPGTAVDDLDTVFHLAGESVFGLWTKSRRDRILQSRVQGTRSVVEALQTSLNPPKTLVCASAIGIYGERGDQELVEETPIAESGFLRDVAFRLENESRRATSFGVRVVNLRLGIVLGRKGALSVMAPLFSLGLGGRIGTGDQWMSWIHISDVTSLFLRAAQDHSLAGPVNATSPFPVRNREFSRALAETLRRPAFLVCPRFALKPLLRDQASLVLDSQRVLPKRALTIGFQFRFPNLPDALADILL
jgi:uncharacterized protein (TIGR01777 family)